ncbi:MAG: hypothetical protein HC890_00770 [Chloroflexaceae bacterium]|nr:hypothetical protein [Chloroflexaceae bacterium]
MLNLLSRRAAALLTLSLTVAAPTVLVMPAQGQLFPSRPSSSGSTTGSVIPAGTRLPVRYEEAEKILVTRTETVPLTLTVAANLRDRSGRLLIPYNSEIVGQIEPAGRGSRFVAEELIFPDGRRTFLNASSDAVTRTETVRRGAGAGDILEGAAIGAAAASVLSAIFGDIGALEVLGGAGLGAIAGVFLGRESAELISIAPEQDLTLTLDSSLALR